VSELTVRFAHTFRAGFELAIEFATARDVTALFGPSGSGKSSTLAVIAGLLRPQEGGVSFNGDVWLESGRRIWVAPEGRRVGMVFQEPLLFPHMTVEGNLRYGERRRSHGPNRIEWTRVLEVLELGPLLVRRPRALSGGERQRVGLGRALLHDPNLLLLDEPLVALDEPLKERILAYLDRVLREWRIPTVYVSHSQAEVRRLAQWVVAIDRGRVVDSGPPDEVLGRALERNGAATRAFTNLLCVVATRRPNGGWNGLVGDQMIHLPDHIQPPDDARCYLQFSPQAVNLVVGPLTDSLSARNRLAGTVRKVLPHHGGALVLADVGQPIWAEVTAESVEALGLKPGTGVNCVIKATAMQVIP
jgi:molybdate transport system ATP-binding protein